MKNLDLSLTISRLTFQITVIIQINKRIIQILNPKREEVGAYGEGERAIEEQQGLTEAIGRWTWSCCFQLREREPAKEIEEKRKREPTQPGKPEIELEFIWVAG
ncbi:hypothetical protein ACFX2B_029763 [Malus domestica]